VVREGRAQLLWDRLRSRFSSSSLDMFFFFPQKLLLLTHSWLGEAMGPSRAGFVSGASLGRVLRWVPTPRARWLIPGDQDLHRPAQACAFPLGWALNTTSPSSSSSSSSETWPVRRAGSSSVAACRSRARRWAGLGVRLILGEQKPHCLPQTFSHPVSEFSLRDEAELVAGRLRPRLFAARFQEREVLEEGIK